MKNIKLLIIAIMLATISTTQAQVSVNINLGTPPVWAPADRVETQYYYLPEIDSYYDVPSERFIYYNNGTWTRSTALPARYQGYNLRSGKVIYLTDYRGKSPYVNHKSHKVKYVTTRYRQPNKVVYVSKRGGNGKHEGHDENRGNNGHGEGKGHGKGKKH